MQPHPLTLINQSLTQAIQIVEKENRGKKINEIDKNFISNAGFITINTKERLLFFQEMAKQSTAGKSDLEKQQILNQMFKENVVWFDIASTSHNINILLSTFKIYGGRPVEELISSSDWLPDLQKSNLFQSNVSGALVEISDRTQKLQKVKQYNFRLLFTPRLMKELVELPLVA